MLELVVLIINDLKSEINIREGVNWFCSRVVYKAPLAFHTQEFAMVG